MSIDFSYTATRKERGRCENNLWASMVNDRSGTNDDQGRFPTSSSPPQRFETASGKAESVHSENICDYDNVQLKKKRSWIVNGKVVWSWFYLLLNMMDATRMARNKDKDPRCSNGGPLQNAKIICDLSRSFVTGKSHSLVGDGV